MQSVAPWVSELLSNYRVLIYNGQLDIIVAYPLTENYLANLKFAGSDQYKNAQRYTLIMFTFIFRLRFIQILLI